FVKKDRQRIHWASRIEVETEASMILTAPSSLGSGTEEAAREEGTVSASLAPWVAKGTGVTTGPTPVNPFAIGGLSAMYNYNPTEVLYNFLAPIPTGRSVTTHKGVDTYEVRWSTDVT